VNAFPGCCVKSASGITIVVAGKTVILFRPCWHFTFQKLEAFVSAARV